MPAEISLRASHGRRRCVTTLLLASAHGLGADATDGDTAFGVVVLDLLTRSKGRGAGLKQTRHLQDKPLNP